jgi:uracil-DNA glycosylase
MPQRSLESAAPLIPGRATLKTLREAAAGCRACPLWADATQTVFGEGPEDAGLVLVGEQPGDAEDRAGHPFVGPAGRVLDRALEQAGIERDAVYLTNAVKHFRWRAGRGKRRIHQRPDAVHINACRPWLEAELAVIAPEVLVCLGAVAAQALLGRQFRVTKQRGQWAESDLAPRVTATVHPSSILRAPDAATRERDFEAFVADLKTAAAALSR